MSTSAHGVGRRFLTLATGEGLARVVSFAAMVYLARLLGPDLFGAVGLALAIMLYFIAIADWGFDALGIRDIAESPERITTMVPAALGARMVIALVAAVSLAVGAFVILPDIEAALLATFALSLPLFAANIRWILLGLERPGLVALSRSLGEIVMAAVIFLLVRRSSDLAAIPLAYFLGNALGALLLAVGVVRLGHRVSIRMDWETAAPVLRRARPLVVHTLLGLLIYNSDFVFLRVFEGRSAVGQYAAGYALISFIINLGDAYGASILPTLTRLGPTPERLAVYRSANVEIGAVALPIAVGGYLLANDIVISIFGSGYGPAGAALAILIWSVPIFLARIPPQSALVAVGEQRRLPTATLVAATTNIVLNFALIPVWGLAGAAVATVITEAVRTAVVVVFARRAGFAGTEGGRLFRPIAAVAIMAGVLLVLPVPVWILVPVGAVVYGVVMVSTGAVIFRRGALPRFNL